MFTKKKPTLSSNPTTLIARGDVINGDISFIGNLVIEGTIKGNVFANDQSAHVRILEHGCVEGEIRAPSLIVNGSVNGRIFSSQNLELAALASIQGDVYYRALQIVKGAQMNGNLIFEENLLLDDDSTPLDDSVRPFEPVKKLAENSKAASA